MVIVAITQLEQGVEVVLTGEIVSHLAVLGAQADAADAPVKITALAHQGIGVIRLMGAMKAAHPDMCNAMLRMACKIGGLGHFVGEVIEIQAIKFHGAISKKVVSVRPQRAMGG